MALGAAAAFVVALIVFVDRETRSANQPAPTLQPSALAEQIREARIVVGQDQAPHVVRLGRGAVPVAALRSAVANYMRDQIRHGTIAGPLTRVACAALSGGAPARRAFHCTAVAASVSYPFDGIVAPPSRLVTYCKRDLPPVPSMNIPVSRRCI